jgi:Zn-dependent protease with chaperone function
MDKFQVNYSNGKTSRLYTAEVTFLSHALSIQYLDEHNTLQVINWEIEKLNSKKFGVSFEHKITYGDFPFETIEVSEEFYTHFHAFYPNLKLSDASTDFIQKKTWKTILVSFLIVCGFSAIMYFFVIPEIADQVAQSIPVEYEMELGEKIYAQNMLPFTVDSAKTELANNYFKNLHVKSPYKVQITVVESDIVNAFAMPGGHIVVFTGLIDQMKHHEEFAGVLAHEYGHIYYRHSLCTMARSLANYALVSLVIGDVSGLAGVLIDNADYIQSMRYSRDLENDADAFGFNLLHKEHVNPKGMVWLFETLNELQKESEKDSNIQLELPEFMSSHPETVKRIKAMEKMAKENKTSILANERLEVIWGQLKR